MTSYCTKDMADSFRTVRKNTILVAQDIPEDKYDYRAAEGVMSVAEMLAHLASSTYWAEQLHFAEQKREVAFEDFARYMGRVAAMEKELTTKPQIVDALKTQGEHFAHFLNALTDEQLAEHVSFPAPVQPSQKTRLEMLLGVKEHEMHHRAKLMLLQRLIGMVPHLTRRRQERQSQAVAGATRG